MSACNIHLGRNKNKMLIMLYSSKTHGKANKPQEIKIKALSDESTRNFSKYRFFCSFNLMRRFLATRGGFVDNTESLFVYRDRSIVTQQSVRLVLKNLLTNLNLNPDYYGFHSFRAGRASDMYYKMHAMIKEIKSAGRWKLSAVYRYLK